MAKLQLKTKFIGWKILGRRTPKLNAQIFMPLWRHITYKSLMQFSQQTPMPKYTKLIFKF